MKQCKKCTKEFEPSKGLVNFCSMICRQGKQWTKEDKEKKSKSSKKSNKVKEANVISSKQRLGKHYKPVVVNICTVCNIAITSLQKRNKKYHAECALLVSGGYRKESGRSKAGWYKGYWCDSSWELAWVIYNIEHKINFQRNKEGFEYEYQGKKYNYYPDFILEDGSFIEIKGFEREKDKWKWKYFKNKLNILLKDDIVMFLKYVVEKYGKNFIELYDGNPHNELLGNCKFCNEPCKLKNKFCSNSCTMKNRHNKAHNTIE